MSSTTNSYWHRIAVRRAGSRDGRDSIPAKDDKHVSPYENELLDRGVLHVGQIEERFAQRIQAARAARESAIAELDATVTRYEEVMHRFADHWSGRDVIAHLSRTTYLWLLAAAGIGEFVLNMQAFNIFGYPLFFTALISLAVAITIPVLAHWAGMVLRQGMRPWSRTVIMIACVASACAGLYGITQARAEYLLHRGVVAEASLLEHAFFLINAMIFVAACAMSFFCHDTDENLEQLHHWAIRLDTDVDRIDRSIDQLAGRIDGLTSQRAAEVEQVHAAIRQLVNLYRRENIRRRSSDDRPV
ncbi:MAG: hypothetical protein FJX72_21815, partial [Armatimonadetes bacterium]|nr:hypothetical protein [Armatimonadota bacterium]